MAGTNFRIRIVVATVGVIQVLNVIIEDGVGNDTAVYAFETAGFIATRITGSPQAVHSGGMAFGSSLLLFDPESGVTVAVLMNQGQNAGHFQLAPQLLALAAGGATANGPARR